MPPNVFSVETGHSCVSQPRAVRVLDRISPVRHPPANLQPPPSAKAHGRLGEIGPVVLFAGQRGIAPVHGHWEYASVSTD
jgi:hypothetical protein